jgi:hypothetical protein
MKSVRTKHKIGSTTFSGIYEKYFFNNTPFSCYRKYANVSLFLVKMLLNVTADWLALLLHVRELLGSNLGLETRYPEFFFCGVS